MMSKKGRARDKITGARILSIVVSLALSFFLWLALSGQDTSTTELSVPLELANLPANLAVKSDVPTSVTLQVVANTAQLRFLNDRKLQVLIDAASAKEGFNAYPVEFESLDLPRGVQVRRVTPPVIEFEAVKTAVKILPLKPVITGAVNPAYQVRALTIEPERVTVRGPQEFLENLTELSTTPISLEGLTRDSGLIVSPATSDLDSSLIVTPREIKVQVSVAERSLEGTFPGLPIELDLKNGASPAGLTLTPEQAEITVSWPASRTRAVAPGEIRVRVFVDLERLEPGTSLSLPVVAVPPAGTTVTAINPVNVTVSRPPAPASGAESGADGFAPSEAGQP